MHRALPVLVLLIFSTFPVSASGGEPEEVQQARKVVQDYEQSERMRIAVELTSASRLVKEHESGRKSAAPEELAAAQDVLRKEEERKATVRKQAIEDTPTFLVLSQSSTIDLARVFDAANREFFRNRIAELKRHIDGNEARYTVRVRQELQAWEKGLSELKPTGRIFASAVAVTVFEEPDGFVVAYFESGGVEQFVCTLRKTDYSPMPLPLEQRRKAANITGLIK